MVEALKAEKITVFEDDVFVYPADPHESIWHVWSKHGPIAELQFVTKPTLVDEPPILIIADDPDYVVLDVPEHYKHWLDTRTFVAGRNPKYPVEFLEPTDDAPDHVLYLFHGALTEIVIPGAKRVVINDPELRTAIRHNLLRGGVAR